MMAAKKTVAITRSEEDAREFSGLVESGDTSVLALPTIELQSRGDSIASDLLAAIAKDDPDYSVFMSSKAVSLLFSAARSASIYDRLRLAVANTSVVAVGPKTREQLESHGIRVAHMPERHSSVGIGEVFSGLGAVGKRAIIPRSGASTPFLRQLLEKIGVAVSELFLYDVRACTGAPGWDEFAQMLQEGRISAAVFTSASSVRAFFEILESKGMGQGAVTDRLRSASVISIGPFTDEELKKRQISGSKVARVHTIRGAAEACTGAMTG